MYKTGFRASSLHRVTSLDGPVVVWRGRRAVHRQSRRWTLAWSPEQIAQRLKINFSEDTTMRIKVVQEKAGNGRNEAIYQALYSQGRGALKRELSACLRSGRALRLPRTRARGRGRSLLADALMISDRPAEVGDRRAWLFTAPLSHMLCICCRAAGQGIAQQCPERGRATSFSVSEVQRLARWWSAQHGSPCFCTCRAWKAMGRAMYPRMDQHWLVTVQRPSAMLSQAQSWDFLRIFAAL